MPRPSSRTTSRSTARRGPNRLPLWARLRRRRILDAFGESFRLIRSRDPDGETVRRRPLRFERRSLCPVMLTTLL